MREWFIVLFTPLARGLTRVHPNTLTWGALASGLLAAICYRLTAMDQRFYLAAALMIAISGAADSLDGIVARMYHRTSVAGDFLDHFCDRVVDGALFVGLAFSAGTDTVPGLLVAVLILLNGNLGTQIKASFGHRPYRGGGKAELFVGMVLFSLLLGLAPADLERFRLGGMTMTDIFLLIVAAATVASMMARLRLATELSRRCSGGTPP
jgi:phosphatidylglycerophosphate synthase